MPASVGRHGLEDAVSEGVAGMIVAPADVFKPMRRMSRVSAIPNQTSTAKD